MLTLAEATEYIKEWVKKEFEIEAGNALIEDTFLEIDKNGDARIQKEELFNHMKEA